MSFSALPRELREEIVRLVAEQDRVFRARQGGSSKRQLAFAERFVYKGWCGRGLIALGEVNKDLRSLVLPVLFDPVHLPRFKSAELCAFPTTQIGQLCRAVTFATAGRYGSIPWYRDIARLKGAFEMLDDLPQLREVDLSGCWDSLRALLEHLAAEEQSRSAGPAPASSIPARSSAARDEDDSSEDDQYSGSDSEDDWDGSASDEDNAAPLNAALISKMSFTGSRVTSWTFDRVDPEITLAFLSLNPSVVQKLDIYDPLSRVGSSPSIEPAVDPSTFVLRIAALPNLTSLALRVHDNHVDETPSIHPAWATAPFACTSALTSLSIRGGRCAKTVASLIDTFASSLQSLTLDCILAKEAPFKLSSCLPALRTLSLLSYDIIRILFFYSGFDTPALRTLEIAVEDPPSQADEPYFTVFCPKGHEGGISAKPMLREVRIGTGGDTYAKPWAKARVAALTRVFTSPSGACPVRVDTAWSQVEDLDVEGKGLTASLGKVRDMAAWMVDQAARIEVTRDEAAARRLVETVKMVAGLREYERE
ncbi:hypothetical protein JCM6882_002432 [Rhodosporidiobolus microsporus]